MLGCQSDGRLPFKVGHCSGPKPNLGTVVSTESDQVDAPCTMPCVFKQELT